MEQFSDRYPSGFRPNKTKNVLRALIIIIAFLMILAAAYLLWQHYTVDAVVVLPANADAPFINPIPKLAAEPETPELHQLLYPVGRLLVAKPERTAFKDGDLILSVPKLDLEVPVLNLPSPIEEGEDAVNLKLRDGVGLFYCSQMPGPENANVSIAGHRDIYGNEFYYLDTLTNGDLIYLLWQGKRYIYEYYETIITGPTDWVPIMTKNFSAVTLQTCTPIGVASHRMFVIGKLVNIEELE